MPMNRDMMKYASLFPWGGYMGEVEVGGGVRYELLMWHECIIGHGLSFLSNANPSASV